MIPVYAGIADHQSGLCYMSKFAEKLGLKENDLTTRLFNMFDNVFFFKF
jgi:hypothetical protein